MYRPRRTVCLHRPVLSHAEGARSRWTREQIRSARRVDLIELLVQRGLHLQSTGNGNYEICEHAGIIVKNWYWRWPDRDACGNTIDFFVDVLGMSFNQAMEAILKGEGAQAVTIPCRGVAQSEAGRSERGNSVPDSVRRSSDFSCEAGERRLDYDGSAAEHSESARS